MAETLRELVVALSLDSSNFSRNMRTINAQIKEAESTFRLAGAGVQNSSLILKNNNVLQYAPAKQILNIFDYAWWFLVF